MPPQETWANALRADRPGDQLRIAAQSRLDAGESAEQVRHDLERFLLAMRQLPEYREDDENLILDTLDALTGWCHPAAHLEPRSR
jgi:hypothetical protein